MRKQIAKWDFIIAGCVLLLSFGLYFLCTGFLGEAVYAEIEIEGKPYARYELKQYKQPQEIMIQTEYGKNLVELSEQGVRVVYADCPDQIDVKQGSIGKSGETIVCLPHKLVIKISGERDIDALSE